MEYEVKIKSLEDKLSNRPETHNVKLQTSLDEDDRLTEDDDDGNLMKTLVNSKPCSVDAMLKYFKDKIKAASDRQRRLTRRGQIAKPRSSWPCCC